MVAEARTERRRLAGAANVTLGCDQPDTGPVYVDDTDGDAIQAERCRRIARSKAH